MQTNIKQIKMSTEPSCERPSYYHIVIEITVVICSLGTPDFEYTMVFIGRAKQDDCSSNHETKIRESQYYFKYVRRMVESLQCCAYIGGFEKAFKEAKFIVDGQSFGKVGKEKYLAGVK